MDVGNYGYLGNYHLTFRGGGQAMILSEENFSRQVL